MNSALAEQRRFPGQPLGRQGTLSPSAAGAAVRFGHYEVHSLVGRGGMASVYRGLDLEGRRAGWPVAIKTVLPQFMKDEVYLKHFMREAALCQKLSHPNIITVYESGVIDGVHFIAMELLDGCDLAQVIRRCTELGIRMPVDFAVYLTHVLLDALGAAHLAKGPTGEPLGIVHCDVSPSNLFISRTGEIKLGDFGIARSATAGTTIEIVAGKPHYLSPEVLDGRVTFEADLWAATTTLYEMLTLQKPFEGDTPVEVFNAICHGKYRPLREVRKDVSPALSKLVDRAFSSRPRRRFPDAQSYAAALAAHYDERVGTPLAIAAVVRGLCGQR